ncbi:rRNA-processing protein UTP23 homolog isoform X1 [Cucumis sativus]|nr:rRNA-processing protein UTP23 homolog isoform X1 [Cucumis sativus]XP_011655273.1 rRNA-processing protein UTP23 homolog isoform X1 [Cucumis sativus]XP_011655274.1 rRNA-processing protein UTP23 homolog isoform X1 [Cucumis sativus]XP_031742195.1 rRNA-processing protein UTP23 homolog isoform X1 [Cucumis sativus]XP_031742196.1 rRNA-processing protein UTP23 homolog isoform X1 [Cucumis sativus]XP_031742197.1 rRNA-processing protein UTP23 homolog isoform X1 [Cucumis sativus]XP_031742198.1 rRNA-pro
MRIKKQKRQRRAVRFYTTCCGFRPPFKIFCDGTFVNHLLSNQIMPADEAVAKTVGDRVKLFTTRCVLLELKALGQSYSGAFEAASQLFTARCDHEKRKSAEACILDVIGESNPEHFFVATQDTNLRKQLQQIPGVPLIFGLRNALFMEQPSDVQRQFVKSLEEKRMHVSEVERDLLKKKTKYVVEAEKTNEDEDLEDQNLDTLVLKKKKKNIPSNLKDRPQFKRNKAKGPNPLSCLKKKVKPSPHPVSEKKKDDDSVAQKRTRKRKRSRKAKAPTETVMS